jgi:hypothetical protein
MAKQKYYAIVHERDGIYVGTALGLAFFSKLDSVGQQHAPLFTDKQSAVTHLKQWGNEFYASHKKYLKYVEVRADQAASLQAPNGKIIPYAGIEQLIDAGLARYLGGMLAHAPTMGRA